MTDAARLKEIFAAALELQTDDERRKFLDEACGDEQQLRDRVEALLLAALSALIALAPRLRPGVPALRPDETLDVVLDKFAHNDVSSLPVCHPDDGQLVTRLVTRQAVMRRYHEELDRQMH